MDFVLYPPATPTEDSNEIVIVKLSKLIQEGTIQFKPLTVEPTWFKTWPGKTKSLIRKLHKYNLATSWVSYITSFYLIW